MTARALIIAVDHYPRLDGLSRDLPGSVAGALKFREWLIDPSGGRVDPANVYLHLSTATALPEGLPNLKGATLHELLDTVVQLMKQGQDRTERLFVLFSGHGVTARSSTDRLFLAMSELESLTLTRPLLPFDQLRSLLRRLGVGRQCFFMDACRTEISSASATLGIEWPREPSSGYAAQATLFSSLPGRGAPVGGEYGSPFMAALLAGLTGAGLAKTWYRGLEPAYQGRLVVTFSSLAQYLERRLEAWPPEAETHGPEAVLHTIDAVPTYPCEITVDPPDPIPLVLQVSQLNGQPVPAVSRTFQGRTTIELPPEWYQFRIEAQHHTATSSPASPVPVFDPQAIRFALHAVTRSQEPVGVLDWRKIVKNLGGEVPFPSVRQLQKLLSGATGALAVRLPGGLEATLLRAVIETPVVEPFAGTHILWELEPGPHLLVLRRGSEEISRQPVEVRSGWNGMLEPRVPRPPRRLVDDLLACLEAGDEAAGLALLPTEEGGPVVDVRLALWLAVLGASRILGPDRYPHLRRLPLMRLEPLAAGEGAVYLLAGGLETAPRLTSGDGAAGAVRTVSGIRGLFEGRVTGLRAAAPITITLADGVAYSIVPPVLPGWVTMIVFDQDPASGPMFVELAVPSPGAPIVGRESLFLGQETPLWRVKLAARAQLEAAAGRWGECRVITGSGVDPVMTPLAVVSRLLENDRVGAGEELAKLEAHFPRSADTLALAHLLDPIRPWPEPPPLVLEPLLAPGPPAWQTGAAIGRPTARLAYRFPFSVWIDLP